MFNAERLLDAIETYTHLAMVLQRVSRNKRNSQGVRNVAMEELHAIRGGVQSLVNQRDQAQTAVSTERSTAPAVLAEADASQVQTGRVV